MATFPSVVRNGHTMSAQSKQDRMPTTCCPKAMIQILEKSLGVSAQTPSFFKVWFCHLLAVWLQVSDLAT